MVTKKIYKQISSVHGLSVLTVMTSSALLSKLVSSVFLVGTWYRPPNSPPERFNEFENVIDKIDAESKKLYILGDINCNLLPEASAHISSYLTNIFDIYGLS